MKYIDAHSHYMPPQVAQNTMFFKFNWSDIERQLSVMDECGIEKSVLLYPTSDAHLNMGGWKEVCRVYNEGISAVVKNDPSRFIGGGILPVDNDDHLMDELLRFQDLQLEVISLASSYDGRYLDHEMFFPVYEFAQKQSIPIHVHSQIINPIGEERVKDPLLTPVIEYVTDVTICIGKMMMSETFRRYPNVKFIFAHYGGVLPIIKERFDTTYLMLRKRNFVKDIGALPSEYFKNLYFDISGSKSAASLQCALEVVDPSQILFGSDYPANQSVDDSLAMIKNSKLTEQQVNGILAMNMQNLLEAGTLQEERF